MTMNEKHGWVGYCIEEGVRDLQRAAATVGALDELSMACDAEEVRRIVRESAAGTLGVMVGRTAGDVSDVNLAAAIARDGRARTVVLVRRDASGSLRSRARSAGIDLVLDPAEACDESAEPEMPGAGGAGPRATLGPLEGRAPVVVLCSGRGGAGKTTLVAALASAASRWGLKVSALDLDFSCGNLHSFFGVRAAVDPLRVAGQPGLEAEALFSAGSGVLTSAPCERPEMAELVMPQVAGMVAAAAGRSDLVLVDTSTTFTDAVAQAAQMADRLLLVTSGTVGVASSLARMGGLAVRLGVARTRIARLENRADPRTRADFSLARAEVGLEAARVFRVFDGGDEVSELMAAGRAADAVELGGPFSRSVETVAAQLLSELGRMPDCEEARHAAEEQTTRKWFLPFGSWREAR